MLSTTGELRGGVASQKKGGSVDRGGKSHHGVYDRKRTGITGLWGKRPRKGTTGAGGNRPAHRGARKSFFRGRGKEKTGKGGRVDAKGTGDKTAVCVVAGKGSPAERGNCMTLKTGRGSREVARGNRVLGKMESLRRKGSLRGKVLTGEWLGEAP